LNPKELADIGIEPDDYGEAWKVCIDYIIDTSDLELEDVHDVCTRVCDHQRDHEKFSETITRLLNEGDSTIMEHFSWQLE